MASSSTTDIDSKNSLQPISWQHLRSGNRATLYPFQMKLLGSNSILECNEIVRVIPGKRLVAFGIWNNKPVVAKLFYSRRAVKHAIREREGLNALQKTGILSPKIYFFGRSADNRVHVLVMERILNGYNLEDIWQSKPSLHDVSRLMHALTIELATQHVMGILQHDLHFKNFIIKQKQVYTIDAGDLEIHNDPLPKKQSLDNLGLYFSQLGIDTEEFQKSLFDTYVKARGWIVSKHDLTLLQNALSTWTARRLNHYDKKILRSSTNFNCISNVSRLTCYDRDYESPNFFNLLLNPDAETYANVNILKLGRSSTVMKFLLDDKPIIIKRYNIKDFWHGLRRCLRETRAVHGWRLALRLRLLAIPTAKPIACIEKRFLGFRHKSYLFMEYIDGIDAGKFFQKYNPREGIGLSVAQEIVKIIKNLARLQITHGDLKMTNIIISKNKPVLIDLDGMRQHKTAQLFNFAYKQDLKRFMRNWEQQPETYAVFDELLMFSNA